jgi:NAD+ kinase
MSMRALGLVPHRDRPAALELARTIAAWFTERSVEVRIPKELGRAIELDATAVEADAFAPGLDLVISLGGDGTMLHAVQLVYSAEVPVLGVNVGQLAYLSEVEPAEVEQVLPRLLALDFRVSERMMLAVDVEAGGESLATSYALNEAVLEKPRTGHLINLDVSVNGSSFTSYAADGIIVATPTGTTAYSFSARGPIASPALACLIVTPISPHMLFDRSLVLARDESIELVVQNDRNVVLTLDGRELGELTGGDRVRCRAADQPLRLATLHPRDFHQILKQKFALPDR